MTFLHNQNILEIILFSLACLGVITIMYGFITVITLFRQIRIRLRAKTEIEIRKMNQPPDRTVSIDIQLEVTKDLLSFINHIIEVESTNKLKTYIPLNTKYEYTYLKEDIEDISSLVYGGLNKDIVFDNPNIFLTNEYIMKYISQQTTIIFMGLVIQYNDNLRKNVAPITE